MDSELKTMDGQMRKGFLENPNSSKLLRDNLLYNVQALTVDYNGFRALDNVTFNIKAGEINFITGKSGAGKTSLLNVLAGDLRASSGKVQRPSNKIFVAQVFQDLKLFKNLTIEENLWYAFDKSIYKSKNEFYKDMMELCSVLGIKDKLQMKVEKANGGLKQYCAIIRALLARPNVLLADEPTAALDKESSIKLFELLNFYNVKRNLTIVWASHNRDLVKQFPGKIIHLEAGKLVYSGHACFI
jgi:ABC-type multidrug transport system ATPase subunit